MADFDFQRLRSVLTPACLTAFRELRENHKDESFYCMGLYTCGLRSSLMPTAMTEEGLDQAFRSNRSYSGSAHRSDDHLRASLRWSPCDSPLHLEGEHHFDEVNKLMNDVYATLRTVDTDHGWEEFDDFTKGVDNAICEVLESVDLAGVFGTRQEREKIFVSILMGDQDDSILEFGRRLNPEKTFQQFEKEWGYTPPD